MKHGRIDLDRIQDPLGLIPIDEPVFLLRGQDPAAAAAVRAWVVVARATGVPEHVCQLAEAQAAQMELWHRMYSPDRAAASAPVPRTEGTYVFRREGERPGPVVVTFAGHQILSRLDLRQHSPDGFQWSYAGSGPAQLAVSLLAHYLRDDDLACRLYQGFKATVLAHETRDEWELTCDDLRAWVEGYFGLPPSEMPLSIRSSAYRQAGVAAGEAAFPCSVVGGVAEAPATEAPA
jgi:hypothetical protein